MALDKSIVTPFGVPAAYWHIYAIDHNRVQRSCQVTLAGYVSQSARAEGARPLATVAVTLDRDAYPGSDAGLAYADVYAALKRMAATAAEGEPLAVLHGAADN